MELGAEWTLWAHLPHDTDWAITSYKEIVTVTSPGLLNGLMEALPDELIKNCMLFFMRAGVMPMWEDPVNKSGGCFSFKVPNKSAASAFRELTDILLGGSISDDLRIRNSIVGLTISPKRTFCIIKLWTATDMSAGLGDMSIPECLSQTQCMFKKHAR